jgi:hypothetical protein
VQLPAKDGVQEVDLRNATKAAVGTARGQVKKNNGIKSPSFAFLSVAAGKTLDEIDSTISSTLNSYGKDRGEVAHGSAARSRTIYGPSLEKASAQSIVQGLSHYFDVIT